MIVTDTVLFKKDRYRVYIDGSFAFVLYKTELKKFGIDKDCEISEELYSYIYNDVLAKRVKLRAMNLLTSRSYTVKQLRDKLSDSEYPDDLIDQALDYVASFGYTDDLAYARDYIFSHRDDKSISRIRSDLMAKGIESHVIEEAFAGSEAVGDTVDEAGQIRRLLKKKAYDPDTADLEEKQKIMAFLYRKGFSSETVRHCLNSLDITYD